MPNHNPEIKIQELGMTLPDAPKPVASYIPAKQCGNTVFISGQIPMVQGKLYALGTVPTQVDEATAVKCAEICTLNALACLKNAIGSLDRVKSVIRVGVFVASTPEYGKHPLIANGCSDLLVHIFGDRGRHARAAVGVSALPLLAPVEIEFIFEIE